MPGASLKPKGRPSVKAHPSSSPSSSCSFVAAAAAAPHGIIFYPTHLSILLLLLRTGGGKRRTTRLLLLYKQAGLFGIRRAGWKKNELTEREMGWGDMDDIYKADRKVLHFHFG